MQIVYQTSPMNIQREEIVLAPLQAGGSPAPLAPAEFMAETSYSCPYVNEQQNSRSAPLPEGKWELGWKTPVLTGMTPRFVLQAGAYLVIQAMNWQIFDGSGKLLGNGRAGPGQVFVDAPSGLLFSIDQDGFLAANQLADGQRKFISSNWGGELSAFSLVQKKGRELLLASFELPKNDFERPPGAEPQPNSSVLELVKFGDSVKVEPGGLVTGTSSKNLRIMATPLKAARNGDTLVSAVPDALLFIDPELKVKASYALKAKPLALSLDEASNAYLIVQTGEHRELWMVTPQGALGFSVKLPFSTEPYPKPPVVGYDHRVFVIIDSELLAIGPNGKLLWKKPLSAKPGGMVVTPTGKLLVSDGAELAAFDKNGERERLFEFSGEQLSTPPFITEKGYILVATETNLFVLRHR